DRGVSVADRARRLRAGAVWRRRAGGALRLVVGMDVDRADRVLSRRRVRLGRLARRSGRQADRVRVPRVSSAAGHPLAARSARAVSGARGESGAARQSFSGRVARVAPVVLLLGFSQLLDVRTERDRLRRRGRFTDERHPCASDRTIPMTTLSCRSSRYTELPTPARQGEARLEIRSTKVTDMSRSVMFALGLCAAVLSLTACDLSKSTHPLSPSVA